MSKQDNGWVSVGGAKGHPDARDVLKKAAGVTRSHSTLKRRARAGDFGPVKHDERGVLLVKASALLDADWSPPAPPWQGQVIERGRQIAKWYVRPDLFTEREAEFARLRYGPSGVDPAPLTEVAAQMGVSKQRAHVIEQQLIDKLLNRGADSD